MPSRDIYKKRRYLFPMGAQSAQSTLVSTCLCNNLHSGSSCSVSD